MPGAPRVLKTAEDILKAGNDYLLWCADNPITVPKTTVQNGKVIAYIEKRNRPPTKIGFAHFVGITKTTLHRFTSPIKEPEYREAAEQVFAAIEAKLLDGGLANDWNGPIVTRVLRLEETITTKSETPEAQVDPLDVPNVVHPDAPPEEAFGDHPLLFTLRQIQAGVSYPHKMKDVTPEALS
jgi:hypothetical protein